MAWLAAAPAFAAEPPPCTDDNMLELVRSHFDNAAQMDPQRKLVSLDLQTDRQGPPPASANLHATATTYIAVSRYCEARAQFDAGEPAPVYWRIDQMMDDGEESTRFDLCHAGFDMFEDGCQAFLPSD